MESISLLISSIIGSAIMLALIIGSFYYFMKVKKIKIKSKAFIAGIILYLIFKFLIATVLGNIIDNISIDNIVLKGSITAIINIIIFILLHFILVKIIYRNKIDGESAISFVASYYILDIYSATNNLIGSVVVYWNMCFSNIQTYFEGIYATAGDNMSLFVDAAIYFYRNMSPSQLIFTAIVVVCYLMIETYIFKHLCGKREKSENMLIMGLIIMQFIVVNIISPLSYFAGVILEIILCVLIAIKSKMYKKCLNLKH